MKNSDIASIFYELANLLEIKGENPFKIRAYKMAARVIENLPTPIEKMLNEQKDLTKLPAIGKEIEAKIKEIVKTKRLSKLEELKRQFPKSLTNLLAIEGLGAKRVKILYEKLGITNENELKKAAKEHKIRELKGFGAKLEEKILNGLKLLKQEGIRFLYKDAKPYAISLVEFLKGAPTIIDVVVAGSFRRKKESVGDLDILATANKPKSVIDYFIRYSDILEVIVAGDTRATIVLKNNLQVDLRVVKSNSFGAALHYFTGSKAHVIKLRKIAQDMGLKINEYGIYKGDKLLASNSEKELYNLFDMQYIEPELRENRGELEAAKNNTLPELIKRGDIRGDLHMHTTFSDGLNSIKEMAKRAKELGYCYIAISDHYSNLALIKGVDSKELFNYLEEIEEVSKKLDIKIFKSLEVDILEDGSLAIEGNLIKDFDFIIGAIHSKFNLTKAKQTKRLLKAFSKIDILAHPTTRIIGKREPIDIDFIEVCKGAVDSGVILEINSQPTRMDLKDNLILEAKKRGVKFSIATDAHSINELYFIEYGVNQARRGWLEKSDVVNTLDLNSLSFN